MSICTFYQCGIWVDVVHPLHCVPTVPVSQLLHAYVAGKSGGGFFDSAVGAQFAKRDTTPSKPAPRQAASPRASSGGGFFDSAVGAQFAKRAETPKAAPKQAVSSRPASKGFFDNAVGAQFANRSEAPKKAAPKKPATKRVTSRKAAAKQVEVEEVEVETEEVDADTEFVSAW